MVLFSRNDYFWLNSSSEKSELCLFYALSEACRKALKAKNVDFVKS